MVICMETGETAAEFQLTASCTKCQNPETGEYEKRGRRAFKIPRQTTPPSPKNRSAGLNKKCCGGSYVIVLAIATLMMFAPAYGVTLWAGLELLYHLYSHRKPGVYQHPLNMFFFEEFCTYCQAKVRMDKVQRLQDRRYRHYISNIPMGT